MSKKLGCDPWRMANKFHFDILNHSLVLLELYYRPKYMAGHRDAK